MCAQNKTYHRLHKSRFIARLWRVSVSWSGFYVYGDLPPKKTSYTLRSSLPDFSSPLPKNHNAMIQIAFFETKETFLRSKENHIILRVNILSKWGYANFITLKTLCPILPNNQIAQRCIYTTLATLHPSKFLANDMLWGNYLFLLCVVPPTITS